MAVGSLGERLEAALLALFGVVLEVKDKNVIYRPLLGSIKSTLECLKPLIEDMEQGNRVLNRPVKELECFRMHLEEGVELVRKCSKNGVFAKYNKKKYTNRLLELDACLQRQLNVLRVQLATNVRETTASIRSMQKMTKQIEESGAMTNQIEMNGPCEVAEPSSPDEQNAGLVELSSPDVHNEGLVSVNEMVAGGDIRVEGSGEVQEKSEIPNWFEVPEPPLFAVGLDVALKEVKMKLLSEDGSSTLGVFGVGGTGKTTLAKMLCHDQEVKDKFKNILFTTASKWPNRNLVMEELHQALCSHVPTFRNKERKHCLVVLDDVQDGPEPIFQDFDGLKIPNTKFLITSRCVFPGVGSQYHLKSLNDEDAMTLFHLSASLGDMSSYIPDDLSRKIVEFCKGLPLALTVIGRSLCGQPIEIWQKRIVEWGRGSIFDTEPEMIVCLKRSLDALKRENTIIKECFVDLASFPEDQIIPAAALIDMWAELYGIDEEYWSIANIHELSIHGLANIVSRKKEIQEDGYYCCDLFVTLHHMLRGLAIHEAGEDTIEHRNRLIIDIHGDNFPSWWTEQKYQPKNARLLSISTDQAFSRKWPFMQLPKVEVLVLNFQTEKYELPDFLDKMEKLKVLIVTNYGSSPAELSNFQLLGSLPNLKIIRLEGVLITSITKNPIQLDSLKKIVFSKCDLGQAFSDSSFQISAAFPNLTEMNVIHCHDLEEFPADIGNLSHLETLYISDCSRLSSLSEGIGNLSKLKMLHLRGCKSLQKIPGSIRKLNSLEFLVSGCINTVEFPKDIGEMSRLRKLNISGCSRLKEQPSSVFSLEQLQEVILDEETEKLWKPFQLKNEHTRVVPPLTVGFDVALEELHRNVLKDGVSRRVECGMAQNKIQNEGLCPVPEPSSLTVGFDVLDVWGAMKMEETLVSEERLKQIEGSGILVKTRLANRGISGNQNKNNIFSNASSSSGRSQLLKATETDESQTDEESLETFFLRRFTYEELRVATGNFSSDGIIAMGAFGNIFKGWLDEKTLGPSKVGYGIPVAVKKLNTESMLDFEEWQSELNFQGSTSHPNLVKLLGYCPEETEMLFVYEFLPNGNLEDHLFRRSPVIETLSWNNRLDIASGVAQGLAGLHSSQKQIIHGDIKACNTILNASDIFLEGGSSQSPTNMLDDSQDAILDYGQQCHHPLWVVSSEMMADRAHRWMPEEKGSSSCFIYLTRHKSELRKSIAELLRQSIHAVGKSIAELLRQSTHAVGTYLCLDPKEITTGHSYAKSDVHSFGVTFLQLLTGLETRDRNLPNGVNNLVEWAKPLLLNERNLETFMDMRIEGQYSSKAAFRAAQITLRCLASDPKCRPSIKEVVEELEQIQAIEQRINHFSTQQQASVNQG